MATLGSATAIRITPDSAWPQAVALRRGWARAEARPWNDDHHHASLRVVRGGGFGFLRAAASALISIGAPWVVSPPLPATATEPWRRAGFRPHLELALLELDLSGACRTPLDFPLLPEDESSLDIAADIDADAFSPYWRMTDTGLADAMAATPSADLLIHETRDAYALVGHGHSLTYLQRIAVRPSARRRGLGSGFVRLAAAEGAMRGAKRMLLNTQLDNEPALELYRAEGFTRSPGSLHLLRFE